MKAAGAAYLPQTRTSPSPFGEAARDHPFLQLAWFAGGAIVACLIPYLFSSVLKVQHDWYYLIYFAFVGTFLGVYVAKNAVDVRAVLRRGWRLSLVLGVFSTVFVLFSVLKREPGTAHPGGAYFGFELLWRGVLYGTADALLLSAFPGLVAFAMLKGDIHGLKRRIGFAALALAMTVIMTATYHLGYAQYREDGIANPEVGNTVISLPTIASANPLGPLVTHATMHVAANIHSYETPVLLPPQTSVTP
jgi:hypothetical protein